MKNELIKVLTKTGRNQQEIETIVDNYLDSLKSEGEDIDNIIVPDMDPESLLEMIESYLSIRNLIKG